MEKEVFILIITCIEPEDTKKVSSSAILLSNFKEALNIAREDAKNYKHLATHYTELIGGQQMSC